MKPITLTRVQAHFVIMVIESFMSNTYADYLKPSAPHWLDSIGFSFTGQLNKNASINQVKLQPVVRHAITDMLGDVACNPLVTKLNRQKAKYLEQKFDSKE